MSKDIGRGNARGRVWADMAHGMSELIATFETSCDERALVQELRTGSETAFAWLVAQYQDAIYNLVFRILGDSGRAADTVQEVFLKVFRGINGFHSGSSIKTWIYRIAIREAANQKRWFWRHWRHQVAIEEKESWGKAAVREALVDRGESPLAAAMSAELEGLVHRALQAVAEPYRSAVVLRDIEGMAYDEIADVLEISLGTVKSRILRGRQALRAILEPHLNGHRKAGTGRAGAGRES